MSNVRAERSLPETTAEFLVWPGDDRAKHYELVDGQVRAMSPASLVHCAIQLTMGSIIRQHLRASGKPCTAMTEPSVQPRLRAEFNVRVPDIGVTCVPFGAGQLVMEQPVLLVEVLSPSNKAETWTNVWTYTTIPSVREIAIVQSQRIEVQILRCSEDRIWPDNPETIQAGGILCLESIGLVCPVEEIYSDTPLV